MDFDRLAERVFRNQSEIEKLVAEIQNTLSFHPRAIKLMEKRKPFVVVAEDEPYYLRVFAMIRAHERHKGTWSVIDEQRYQEARIRITEESQRNA